LHWTERARRTAAARGDTRVIAASALREHKLSAVRPQRRMQLRMMLLRGSGQRLLDRDQVVATLKPVVDGLCDAGWIVDDSEKWLEYTMPRQKIDREHGPAVIVELEAS
jgi:hypothetical protein